MGAGAGQRGGMPRQAPQQQMPRMPMPSMGRMPQGMPPQGMPPQAGMAGLGALAAQGGQMDPRLLALMQAMQQQGGMPPMQEQQVGMPDPRMIAAMQQGGPQGMPAMQPGPMQGGRPMTAGAGGKGAGMPTRPGMTNPRGQAAQSVNPFMAQMMRGGMR